MACLMVVACPVKSTIGKYISEKFAYQYVDTDRLIEAYCKNDHLQNIVDGFSDDYHSFLKLERQVIAHYVSTRVKEEGANDGLGKKDAGAEKKKKDDAGAGRKVFATGGSMCYSKEAVLMLDGIVFYLNISWKELNNRTRGFADCGFISFHDSIEEEYKYRLNLYPTICDIEIICDGKTVDEIAHEIIEKSGEYSRTLS